jgi:membrane protein implicated in regulation of membrane protease activity
MIEFLNGPSYWLWFILGVVLIVMEMVAPGVVFLWLGLAALATGVVAAAGSMLSWELQLLCFAILSAVSIVAGRRFVVRRATPHDHPGLNARGSTYIGKTYVVAEPVVNGRGKLTIDDTIWIVSGADAPAGAKVKVTGQDGTILKIEPAD